jgi:hypothetical protein
MPNLKDLAYLKKLAPIRVKRVGVFFSAKKTGKYLVRVAKND